MKGKMMGVAGGGSRRSVGIKIQCFAASMANNVLTLLYFLFLLLWGFYNIDQLDFLVDNCAQRQQLLSNTAAVIKTEALEVHSN